MSPGASENYSRNSHDRCVSAACIRANVREACARHFMYYSGWGVDFLCLSSLLTAPWFFFSTHKTRGCLWVYYTTDPIRSATHTRAREEIHTRPAYDYAGCIWERVFRPLRIGRVREILPSRTTRASISRACGTIKKYPNRVKINLTLGRRDQNQPDRPNRPGAPLTRGNRNEWSRVCEKYESRIWKKATSPTTLRRNFLLYSLCNASLARRYSAHIALV